MGWICQAEKFWFLAFLKSMCIVLDTLDAISSDVAMPYIM